MGAAEKATQEADKDAAELQAFREQKAAADAARVAEAATPAMPTKDVTYKLYDKNSSADNPEYLCVDCDGDVEFRRTKAAAALFMFNRPESCAPGSTSHFQIVEARTGKHFRQGNPHYDWPDGAPRMGFRNQNSELATKLQCYFHVDPNGGLTQTATHHNHLVVHRTENKLYLAKGEGINFVFEVVH